MTPKEFLLQLFFNPIECTQLPDANACADGDVRKNKKGDYYILIDGEWEILERGGNHG